MRKIWIAFLMMAPCLIAQADEKNGREVSGGIVTNFLNEGTGDVNGTSFVNETLGTATGDLKGGLGVYVLTLQMGPNGTLMFHNHHHWVTEAGDTIFLADADAIAYPVPGNPGLFAGVYPNGVEIIGGTGRFAGASGNIASWGAVDQNTGQIVLRYQGTIYFARPEH